MSEDAHSGSAKQPQDVGRLKLTPASEVERPILTPAAGATRVTLTPAAEVNRPSDWRRSEIVDVAPRWQGREPEQTKKKKKSRWNATPDCVLLTEPFDEHAKDTMMKSGLYTWTVGSANETSNKWKFIASTGDVAKGDVLVEGESQIYSAQAYQLLSKAAGPKNKTGDSGVAQAGDECQRRSHQ